MTDQSAAATDKDPRSPASAACGASRPRVLLVDDEANLLRALARQLRREYDLTAALSAEEALRAIATATSPFAVIVSDMRMPGMDGATFLSCARTGSADSTRILLTGEADLRSAIAAVNEGRIFRFLTKPCSPEDLGAALSAAVEQHRLVTLERELLEKTLQGAVRALVETLALASPVAFGKATRVQKIATALVRRLDVEPRWPIELAAMLSQLGAIVLPDSVLEQLHEGRMLAPEEQAMVQRMPEVTEQLLANIPRLELVREILRQIPLDFQAAPQTVLGARLLRVAIDFDTAQGTMGSLSDAVAILRSRAKAYDPAVLEALVAEYLGDAGEVPLIRELRVAELRPGMVLVDDVRTTRGMLIVARETEVTASLEERLRNFIRTGIREPLRVRDRVRAPR